MATRIDHATIITPQGDGVATLADHAVTFDGGQVAYLGPTADANQSAIRNPKSAMGLDIVDGSRLLVIPGLVNTHHHLFQTLTRGHRAVQSAKLFDWLVRQYPIWRHMDYEALKAAATISMAEMLLG